MKVLHEQDTVIELSEPITLQPEDLSKSRLGTYLYTLKIFKECESKLLKLIELPNINEAEIEIASNEFAVIKKECRNRWGQLLEISRFEKFFELSKDKKADYWELREEIILVYDYTRNADPSEWNDSVFNEIHLRLDRAIDFSDFKNITMEFKSLVDNLLQQKEL
jgi:hypothetical protein